MDITDYQVYIDKNGIPVVTKYNEKTKMKVVMKFASDENSEQINECVINTLKRQYIDRVLHENNEKSSFPN